MSETHLKPNRCFLCRRKKLSTKMCKNIAGNCCPSSKKNIKTALEYLARINKTELQVTGDEMLCLNCYNLVIDYDSAVVKALQIQQNLVHLIEGASIAEVFSDFEDDCNQDMVTMEEITDSHYFDDVMISDTEIEETVKDAIDVRKKFRPDGNDCSYNGSSSGAKHRNHFLEQILQCPLCAMRFRSKIRMQKHIVNAHKKYKCEMCDYSHRNEDYVKLHMNIHEGRSENCCLFCYKEFTTKISTIRHMEVHMDLKKYQCDKCGLCFSQTTILYNHKLQHEAEEQPLQCDVCNQVFKTKRTYRHHMITHRADRPRYSCEYCSKTFTEKYTLKVHKRTHPEASESQSQHQQLQLQATPEVGSTVQVQSTAFDEFNCIICDQPFLTKEHMNKHMERAHDVILKSLTLTNFSQFEEVTNEANKPCHICGQMFGTQANLDTHLKNMHSVSFK